MAEQQCPKCGTIMKCVWSWSDPRCFEYECPVCGYSCTPEGAKAETQDKSRIAFRQECQKKILDALAEYKKNSSVLDQYCFKNWIHSLT